MALHKAPALRVISLNPVGGDGVPGHHLGAPSFHSEYATGIIQRRNSDWQEAKDPDDGLVFP